MKKYISIAASVLLSLGLCSCAASGSAGSDGIETSVYTMSSAGSQNYGQTAQDEATSGYGSEDFYEATTQASTAGEAEMAALRKDWPSKGGAAQLPLPNCGTVASYNYLDNGGCVISVQNVTEQTAEDYAQQLKASGFSNNSAHTKTDTVYGFYADNGEYTVSVSYSAGTMGISVVNAVA